MEPGTSEVANAAQDRMMLQHVLWELDQIANKPRREWHKPIFLARDLLAWAEDLTQPPEYRQVKD